MPDSKFKPISTFLTLPNFQFPIYLHLMLVESGICWVSWVETSLDRLSVWEMSGVGVWMGGHGMFVFEILCKHVFLWVCPTIMASYLCLFLFISCVILVTVTFLPSCPYCPCWHITIYILTSLLFCHVLPCRSVTRPLRRFMPWSSSASLRWSKGQIRPSSGRRDTSWPSPTAPGSSRCVFCFFSTNIHKM